MSDTKEKREGLFQKEQSRRDFLKLTGKGMAGGLVALFLGSAATLTAKDGKQYRVWATPTGAIVHDPNRCVGCKRCEVACTVRNDGKASAFLSRIKVTRNQNFGVKGPSSAYQKTDGQLGNFRIVADVCRQCHEPACGNACPIGAIYTDAATSVRVVDKNRCVGCGTCARACPWSIPTVDTETGISTKCTTCEGDPTCAKSCPTGAIRYMPYAEAEKFFWGTDAVSGASA